MTLRNSISDKDKPLNLQKYGTTSMFVDYEKANEAAPPVDTESTEEKQPASN